MHVIFLILPYWLFDVSFWAQCCDFAKSARTTWTAKDESAVYKEHSGGA